MLDIIQSSEMAQLVDEFIARHQQTTAKDIFSEATVIVPALSVGDYLIQQVTARQGVSARITCQFWGQYEWTLVERINEIRASRETPLSVSAMQWEIFSYLCRTYESILQDDQHPLHTQISDLCQQSSSELYMQRFWYFSGDCARIFSDYQRLRPDWLCAWQNSDIDLALPQSLVKKLKDKPTWFSKYYEAVASMQRYLWQTQFAEIYAARCQHVDNFWTLIETSAQARAYLPVHLHVLTPFTLTTATLSFLRRLAQYIPVTLYHLAVCEHYMGDIVDSRWLRQLRAMHSDTDAQHYSSGHPLVSRWGKQMRDIARLFDSEQQTENITIRPRKSVTTTLLGTVQYDLRMLNDMPTAYVARAEMDDSLCIHCCGDVLRQLEILRAEIVRWLNADTTRRLDDIVVVMPDLARYQHVIRMVFPGEGGSDGYILPARLTGVASMAQNRLWLALSGIYTLAMSDFDVESVRRWWLIPEVTMVYGLEVEAVQEIFSELIRAGFRRGFDHEHMVEILDCDDGDDRFTFCYALDRLVSGLTMPQAEQYVSSVPMDNLALKHWSAIEALTLFTAQIRDIRAQLTAKNDDYFWLTTLQNRHRETFALWQNTAAYQTIANTLHTFMEELTAHAQVKTFSRAEFQLPLAFVLRYVEEVLAQRQVSSEPGGVITFGRIGALRALPYRLIAFVGADADIFPRKQRDNRHNLIEIDHHQFGDRNAEWDDTGAFLDMLNSAQDACWIFYRAYEADNTEICLPAAPVQDLLAYLTESYPDCLSQYRHEHVTSPFLMDKSATHPPPLWAKVQSDMLQQHKVHAWLTLSAAPSQETLRQSYQTFTDTRAIWALDTVAKDIANAARTFLRSQGIFSPRHNSPPDVIEPLFLNNLEQWKLTQEILNRNNIKTAQTAEVVQRLPLLPVGCARLIRYEQQLHQIEKQRNVLKGQDGVMSKMQEQVVDFNGQQLRALLPSQPTICWQQISPGKAKVKTILQHWLSHCLWQWQFSSGNQRIAFQDKVITFSTLTRESAAEQLRLYLGFWQWIQHNPCAFSIEDGWKILQKKTNSKSHRCNVEVLRDDKDWALLFYGQDEETQQNMTDQTTNTIATLLFAELQTAMTSCDI